MNLFVSRLKQVFIFLFFALIFINVNFAKADSHDELSENLKQSLTKVINENVTEDLQKAIVKYVSAISQNISVDNKTTLLQSTKEMLSVSSNLNKNDFNKIAKTSSELENLNLIIDDNPVLTIPILRARARRLKRLHDINLIIGLDRRKTSYEALFCTEFKGSKDSLVAGGARLRLRS